MKFPSISANVSLLPLAMLSDVLAVVPDLVASFAFDGIMTLSPFYHRRCLRGDKDIYFGCWEIMFYFLFFFLRYQPQTSLKLLYLSFMRSGFCFRSCCSCSPDLLMSLSLLTNCLLSIGSSSPMFLGVK